jgi:adenosine deaminase
MRGEPTRGAGAGVSALDLSLVRALPKLELHVHLEGTFSTERIAVMAEEVGEPLPRPVERLFTFEDLSSFLGFLDWTCGLIRTPELAAQVAYDYAARASRDGVLYAEVIVNPTHWNGWDLEELVGALDTGFARAKADGLAECHLLLSILRAQSADEALALVEWMGRHRHPRVVGLSVDGDERRAGRTGPRFAPAYRRAGELGFGLTAHAGESSGAEGVRDALELLHVHRIDHGVRAVDDPTLMRRLAEERIALNVCLSSNLVHLYPDAAAHPFPALHAAGVPLTVNTDDPGYLGIDLTGEFTKVAELMSWGLPELAAVSHRAVDASFGPPTRGAELHRTIDTFLADHTETRP